MLLIGPRLQSALATWVQRRTGVTAIWTGTDVQGYPEYVALTPSTATLVSNYTWGAIDTTAAMRFLFAPDLGATVAYDLLIGGSPLRAVVQAGDDAEAAQARVAEGWAAGLWALDGWTLAPLGGGVWQVTPPPWPLVGIMPAVLPGYGWSIVGSDPAGQRDVTLTTSLLAVRVVAWCPVRSWLAGQARITTLISAIRSDSENADRGADLGLAWGTRPDLSEPSLGTLDGQTDLANMVDAAACELSVYAHSLTTTEGAGLAGYSLTVAPLPGTPVTVETL